MARTPFLKDAKISLRPDGAVSIEMWPQTNADAERLYDAVTGDFLSGIVVFGEIEISTPHSVENPQ